jgi:ribonuclease HI
LDENNWARGGWPVNTNNVAELSAVLNLLQSTKGQPELGLVVQTDSQYVIGCLTKWIHGWKSARGREPWTNSKGEPVKNREIIQAIDNEMVGRKIRFEWVKGHNGHPRQEMADTLAVACSRAISARDEYSEGPGWNLS